MKIKRFNRLNESLSTDHWVEIKNYIDFFGESLDDGIDGIIDWIKDSATDTKLEEYKNMNSLDFCEKKNLPKYKEFLYFDGLIRDLKEKINQLEQEKIDNVDHYELINELLYKFQEDLLDRDFDNFYYNFLEYYSDNKEKYKDIHPDILKKYKDIIDARIDAKKYNL